MEEEDAHSEEEKSKPEAPKGGFKASKWDEVDPELVEQQAMTTSKWDKLETHDDDDDDSDDDDRRSDKGGAKGIVDYDDDLDGVYVLFMQTVQISSF